MLKRGTRWAMLECIKVTDEAKPVMLDDGRGGKYNSGEFEYTREYVLRCDCGKKVTVEINKFPGKRKMSDCGCGLGKNEGRAIIRTVSLSSTLYTDIEEFADNSGMTFSGVLQKWARLGQKVEVGEIRMTVGKEA